MLGILGIVALSVGLGFGAFFMMSARSAARMLIGFALCVLAIAAQAAIAMKT